MALRRFWSVVTEPSVRSALRRRLFSHSLLFPALLPPACCTASPLWEGLGATLGECVRRLPLGSKMPFKCRQWWRNSLLGNFSDDSGHIYTECDTETDSQVQFFLQLLFCLSSILIFVPVGIWNRYLGENKSTTGFSDWGINVTGHVFIYYITVLEHQQVILKNIYIY